MRRNKDLSSRIKRGPGRTEASAGRGRRAVVIGGGVAGLSSAALLARDGWSVDLVEARTDLGGRAGSWSRGGFRFDTGPSWYLLPEVFDHFFNLLGTSAGAELDLRQLDPGYRVHFEYAEEPLEISASTEENLARFEAIEPGAGKRLERYLASAQDTREVALSHFLYTSFTSLRPFLTPSILRRAPRLLPLLFHSLDRFTAQQFSDPRLRQVLGYPAVFLGSAPATTPSLYHLMSSLDLTGGVLYPSGGFARVVEVLVDLARRNGVRLHTDTPASAILTTPSGPGRHRATATGVKVLDAEGAERTLPADVVVASADLHHVETTMLPPQLQTYPESWWRRRTPGPGAVLVMLGVRGELPQLDHHTLLFTEDWSANFGAIAAGRVPRPASAYVCKPSATDASVAPPGHENLFVLVPVPADPSLGRGGLDGTGSRLVEQVADAAIDQLARWTGVPDLADRIVVRRTLGPGDFSGDLAAWQGSMLGPGHTLSQSAFFRAGNASRRVASLYYAGSSTIPGVGVPMCLISAEILLKRLRGDTSVGPLDPSEMALAEHRTNPDAPEVIA